ncbi:MAG: CotH kinase family protein [Chitinispirillaceae bacterium]|nr:CotH kinase family protein [Chitinispirillaceae bacterium]
MRIRSMIVAVSVAVSFFCSISLADFIMLSGTVVDSSDVVKPVKGVLVSIGHTLYRTTTDSLGQFSIEVPSTVKTMETRSLRRLTGQVTFNSRLNTIDVSRAPNVKTVSLFDLKGSRLFCTDFTKGSRIRSFPRYTSSISIVTITSNDNSQYSFRLSPFQAHSTFSLSNITGTLGKQAVQSAEAVKLLFHHDDFFPVERPVTSQAETFSIAMKPDPRHFVFDQTKIHEYHFTIAQSDSVYMEKNALKADDEKVFVPADFTFNDSVIGKVGIRFKGSQYYLLKQCFDSTGRLTDSAECLKISLKVKFNKYDDNLRFYSLKRLNMHGMSDDPSKMREMISYRIFRDMGVYASKTAYIKVYINGAFWGIHLAVEELDGRFTKSRWPEEGDGNLYKELWPSYHTEVEVRKKLATNNNPEDSADIKNMWNFCRRYIPQLTAANFKETTRQYMNIDYWLRYITVDRAIHNADGIMTWYYDTASGWSGNHNFYIYEDDGPQKKLWFIPWDLPGTLTKTDMIIDDYGVPEWNVKPSNCDSAYKIWSGDFALAPNCDPLLGATAEAMWPEFVATGEQLLSTCFTADRLQAMVDTYKELISPVIEKDPTVTSEVWEKGVEYLREAMPILNKGYDDYIHGKSGSGEAK